MSQSLRLILMPDGRFLFISWQGKDQAPKGLPGLFMRCPLPWPGLETILSGFFIESMERLCILSERLHQTKEHQKMDGGKKYQFCTNSPSTLACCQNPMGPETTVWHNFYIYFGLAAISVGLRKLLSPSFFWFSLIRWHSSLKMQK